MRRFEGSGKSGRRDSNRSEHSGPSRFNRRDSESDDSGPRRFSRRDSSDSDNGGSRRFGGRDSGRKSFEMHKVTCDKCGQSCEVPFKPTSGKPVYCSDCFKKVGKTESRRPPKYSNESSENLESDKPNKYQHEFDQINEKLNKILKALELD